MKHEELTQGLRKLSLHAMAVQYAEVARVAEKGRLTYEQYLASLTKAELSAKLEARTSRLVREAKLPLIKRLETYDYSEREGITPVEVNRLAQGEFVREGSNVVLYGTFGVGKSHLATGLVLKLCEHGHRCLFSSTHALIEQMLEAKAALTLTQLFKKLDKYDLLVLDELGYLPESKDGADLLFQLVSVRSERKSILVTTNLTFSEWDKVFVNQLNTAGAVDRLIHRCETFNIKGPSWRAEEAKKRTATKMKTNLAPNKAEDFPESATGSHS